MIRARLKDTTKKDHERLQMRLDLLGPQIDRAGYVSLLKRFYGFYFPLEVRLLHCLKDHMEGLDFSSRKKAPLLGEDLRFFGLHSLDDLPLCVALPELKSFSSGLGCLYVVEGSTLGGQFLSRHFETRFDVRPRMGCSFFSGYGESTGTMWKSFLNVLEACATDEQTCGTMIESASQTFLALEAWMTNGQP